MDLRARGRQNEGIEIQENKLLKSAGGNRSYSQGQAGKKKKQNRQGAVKNTCIRKSKLNHKHEEHRQPGTDGERGMAYIGSRTRR